MADDQHNQPDAAPSNVLLEAVARIERLSPAPRILGKAMALLHNPNSSVDDIASLVTTDSALSAQIIRSANSAFYGGGMKVNSRLVNLLVTQSVIANGLNCYGISAEAYWTECLYNGLFMEELALKTGSADTGEAHTAGLLRYIGRMAIDQGIKELGFGLFWDGQVPLTQWEVGSVGFTHSTAAGLLLQHWNFPVQLVEAIQWQDEPQRAPTPSWLAHGLHFTAAVLSPGAPTPAGEANLPEIKTSFAAENHLTMVAVRDLIDATSRRFKAIRGGLFHVAA